MATKEENNDDDGGSSTTQRKRFYIELKPGETTIVSWKKLLRETKEKDHCPLITVTASSALDGNYDGGQHHNSAMRNKRVKHVKTAPSSDYMQPSKKGIELTKLEGEKNGGHSSSKLGGSKKKSAKATAKTSNLFDETLRHSSLSSRIKDCQSEELQALTLHNPVFTYSKKSASSCSKPKCSPPNTAEDAYVFSLKTMHSVLQKTQEISSEKIKVGVGGDTSDANTTLQHIEGRCVALKTSPATGVLTHDKVSFKNRHNDKSGGSWKLDDAISPNHMSLLKDSKDMVAAVNETKPVYPSNKVLERAIGELEDAVAKSKCLHFGSLYAHASWLTVERELPSEVKLKLGKVASIVVLQSGKEIASRELVNRLASILGKLVHGKSLKRTLRKLVMLKLSARKEKAEKFKEIKNEILTMVSNHHIRAAEGQMYAETYKLEGTLEDKLCDLYELCFKGIGEDKDAEVQKLFVELAELWPKGVMDPLKLTEAINRAKSRRAIAYKNRGQKVLESVQRIPDPVPFLKRKVIHSSNNCNSIPSLSSKKAPKKSTIEQPALQCKNSSVPAKGVKLTLKQKQKQKQSVPVKANVKVKFLLRQEHGTPKADEQAAKDMLSQSRGAASQMFKQPV